MGSDSSGLLGLSPSFSVDAARDTGTQINLQPILEIDLLVMRAGQPPYPATVRQMVTQAQLGLIAAGSTVSVRVDPANPATVLLGI